MNTPVSEPLRSGKAERQQVIADYMTYLDRRDGPLCADGETLTFREDSMRRLRDQKVRWQGTLDHELFQQQYARFSPARPTPDDMLLLLAFVKINSHEAFAVDAITASRKKISTEESRVIRQERYHTQLLLSAADLFGLSVNQAATVPRALRVLVTGVAHTPAFIMHPLAMAGEILGVASFNRLLRATRSTLSHQPELRDALEERVMEVLTDEVGHMSYNRLCLGRTGMAAVRMLLPPLLASFRNTVPELERLCGGPVTMAEVAGLSFAGLPEAATRNAFVA
jgi:hypothetical protein